MKNKINEIMKMYSEIIESAKNNHVEKTKTYLYFLIMMLLAEIVAIVYVFKHENISLSIWLMYCGFAMLSITLVGFCSFWFSNANKSKELAEIALNITLIILLAMLLPYCLIYILVNKIFMEPKDDYKDCMNLIIVFAIEMTLYTIFLVLIYLSITKTSCMLVLSNIGIKPEFVYCVIIFVLYGITFYKQIVTLIRRTGMLVLDGEDDEFEDEYICNCMKKIFVSILLIFYFVVSFVVGMEKSADGIKDAITVVTIYVLFVDKRKEYSDMSKNKNAKEMNQKLKSNICYTENEGNNQEFDMDYIDDLYKRWKKTSFSGKEYLKILEIMRGKLSSSNNDLRFKLKKILESEIKQKNAESESYKIEMTVFAAILTIAFTSIMHGAASATVSSVLIVLSISILWPIRCVTCDRMRKLGLYEETLKMINELD